jgi:hypothetical protein
VAGLGAAEFGIAGQPLTDLGERCGASDRQSGNERRLGKVGLRHDEQPCACAPSRECRRQHAPYSTHVPAEAELADRPQAVEGGRRDRAGGGQQADGDRQVEAGPVLGQVGGWQRDGHPAVRPVEAGVAEGRADAVAGLQDGGVAEPHHGDRRQAAADVDLDADGVGDEADQRGGRQPGQHGSEGPFQAVDHPAVAARPQHHAEPPRTTDRLRRPGVSSARSWGGTATSSGGAVGEVDAACHAAPHPGRGAHRPVDDQPGNHASAGSGGSKAVAPRRSALGW